MAIAPLSVEEVQLEAEGRMVRTLTQVDEAARLKAEAERKRLREEVALLKAEAERNKKNEPQPSSTGGGVGAVRGWEGAGVVVVVVVGGGARWQQVRNSLYIYIYNKNNTNTKI